MKTEDLTHSSNQPAKSEWIDAIDQHEHHNKILERLIRALQASESRWRALIENTQDWVWEVDKAGHYTYASPRVQTMLGYAPEEVLGKTPFDFMPIEERERVLAAFTTALVHHSPFQGLENINRRRDGSLIVLETNGVPFFDEQGEFAGYRGIDRDISERKRIEMELRRKSEELEAMFSNTHILIAVLDRDFNFLRVNRSYAAMAHMKEESLVGRNHFELYPNEENEQLFRQVVQTGKAYSITAKPFEFPEQPELGTTYWDWSLRPIKDDKGRVEGTVLTLIDATERERQRQAAEAAQCQAQAQLELRVRERTAALEAAYQELEAFSYAVSHDLRAPLRAIKGFSSALQEDCSDALTDQGRMHLERIHRATVRMSEFIEGLLSLSLISRHELQTQPVNLSAIAHEVILHLREENPARTLEICIEPGLAAIGDVTLLRLLLQNLLGNAWKFTAHRSDARIELGRIQMRGCDVFVVHDNGVGFDMDNAAKLFKPFTRLHGRDEFEGNGIGLATVRRIVECHGGMVWAEGKLQHGTSFFFTLAATARDS